jgi:hypothetical protein
MSKSLKIEIKADRAKSGDGRLRSLNKSGLE